MIPFVEAPSIEQESFLSHIALNTEQVISEIVFLIAAWRLAIQGI